MIAFEPIGFGQIFSCISWYLHLWCLNDLPSFWEKIQKKDDFKIKFETFFSLSSFSSSKINKNQMTFGWTTKLTTEIVADEKDKQLKNINA